MPGQETNRRILLILDRCGLGEALRVSPMLGAVRAAHPSAFITLLVSEQAYPLFLDDGRFDRVLPSDMYGRRRRRMPRLRVLVAAGRLAVRLGFREDLVITFLWGTNVLNAIGWVAGRHRRIGYRHRFAGLLTSGLVGYGAEGDVPANLALLKAAGIPPPDARSPALVVGQAEQATARQLLASGGRRPQRPLVVMHPGSDWACQQWLPERWAQLADRIGDQRDADIVFTGLADERDYIQQIQDRMTSTSISIAGETSLLQLAAVISQAGLCVSVDSAAHDLAQALGVPAVVLAGPTMPESPTGRPLHLINRTLPQNRGTILGCQARFPLGLCHDYSCPFAGLKNISVDRVLDAMAGSGCFPTTPMSAINALEAAGAAQEGR